MASKKRIPGIFCFMKSKIVKKPHHAALKLDWIPRHKGLGMTNAGEACHPGLVPGSTFITSR